MSENPSGLDILEEILQGLWLDNSDAGYQRLTEILDADYGVMVTAEKLRSLGHQIPVHPVLETMRKWPWKCAADEDCHRFYEMLRVAAQQAGLNVPEEK